MLQKTRKLEKNMIDSRIQDLEEGKRLPLVRDDRFKAPRMTGFHRAFIGWDEPTFENEALTHWASIY